MHSSLRIITRISLLALLSFHGTSHCMSRALSSAARLACACPLPKTFHESRLPFAHAVGKNCALLEAAKVGYPDRLENETRKMLASTGDDTAKCILNMALYRAVTAGHPQAVRHLLAQGAAPDACYQTCCRSLSASEVPEHARRIGPPLHVACRHGFTDVAQELLEAGAPADLMTDETALSVACRNGHAETVRCLLHAGASPNTADHTWRMTPLMHAVNNEKAEIVALLLHDARTNLSACDYTGETAYDKVTHKKMLVTQSVLGDQELLERLHNLCSISRMLREAKTRS